MHTSRKEKRAGGETLLRSRMFHSPLVIGLVERRSVGGMSFFHCECRRIQVENLEEEGVGKPCSGLEH